MELPLTSPLRRDVSSLPALKIRQRHRLRIRANEEKTPSKEGTAQKPSKNDLLERIAKAQAYKAKRQSEESVAVAGPSSFGDELERPEDSARRLSNAAFQAQFNRGAAQTDAPSFREAVDVNEEIQEAVAFKGTSEQRASFLPNDEIVVRDPSVRPEDFVLEEEERRRRRGADVISVDKSYKPKVSTWGMYPRPANISEAFGGGRTIDPTKPLESDVATEERQAEIAAALVEYKKKRGLYVDPEVEGIYQRTFQEGEELLKCGNLLSAAQKFEDASRIVAFKTQLGGDALFKRAICLDSLGKSKPAKAIYEQLSK